MAAKNPKKKSSIPAASSSSSTADEDSASSSSEEEQSLPRRPSPAMIPAKNLASSPTAAKPKSIGRSDPAPSSSDGSEDESEETTRDAKMKEQKYPANGRPDPDSSSSEGSEDEEEESEETTQDAKQKTQKYPTNGNTAPAPSSSEDSEDEEEEMHETMPNAKQKAQKYPPKGNSAPASATSSSEGSEDEEEESKETRRDTKQKTQKYQPNRNSAPAPSSNKRSEYSEDTRPEDKLKKPKHPATIPATKPVIPVSAAAAPHSGEESNEEEKTEMEGLEETSFKASQKLLQKPAGGGEDSSTSKSGSKLPTSRKRKLFQRLWSESDELKILTGIIAFQKSNGPAPPSALNINALYTFFLENKTIGFHFSKGQLKEKLRRLKHRYENKSGDTSDLVRKIWGFNEPSSGAAGISIDGILDLLEKEQELGISRASAIAALDHVDSNKLAALSMKIAKHMNNSVKQRIQQLEIRREALRIYSQSLSTSLKPTFL